MAEWIVVYNTNNLPDAHIVKGLLESHDIPALVQQEAVGSIMGLSFGRLGEVVVLVPEAEHDHALDVLEPQEPDALEDSTSPIIYRGLDEDDQ